MVVPSSEKTLFTVQLAVVIVLVPDPGKVRLLKVVGEAESVWLPAAPKLTVPVPALKTEPSPFQADVLMAFSFRILDPPFKVPAVSVITSVKVCVNGVPASRIKVPAGPLMVSPAPFIFPVKVAVPPVLDIVTVPNVLKAPIL